MRLQLAHAIRKQPDVLHHVANLFADLVGGYPHGGVLAHLFYDLDCHHHQRRRDDHDAGAVRALHHVVEALVQIRVDRFGRNEHQRDVLRLSGDEIFVRNVGDVLGNVLLNARHRNFALLIGCGVAPCGHRFERKFRVNDERAGFRHENRAIGPRLVRQRELELERAFRQRVGNDRFQLPLSEGAARLLVGEHAVQGVHLRRQIGDVFLRRIDHRQPLV